MTDETCHCGKPVAYGYDGDCDEAGYPKHHRGMCADCDAVRCDAHPGACRDVPTADPAYTAWRDAIHARHLRDLEHRLDVAEATNHALLGALYDALEGRVDTNRKRPQGDA